MGHTFLNMIVLFSQSTVSILRHEFGLRQLATGIHVAFYDLITGINEKCLVCIISCMLSISKYFLCAYHQSGHVANAAPKEGNLEEGKIQMVQASKNICKKIQ